MNGYDKFSQSAGEVLGLAIIVFGVIVAVLGAGEFLIWLLSFILK